MATNYPRFKFTGINIAVITLTYPIHTKPHVKFLQQVNILNGLPYTDNTFNYVICRFMIFTFMIKDQKFVINEYAEYAKLEGNFTKSVSAKIILISC
jgi:hypothetical protein